MKLVLAPDPIFKKKASLVEIVDVRVQNIITNMFRVLYEEDGIGLGANMVGILERIVITDHKDGGSPNPKTYINPVIQMISDEMQSFTEASLSFPGINAVINRPKVVTVNYLDFDGKACSEQLSGWPATVLQHEIDYLDGIVFLDHLSATKRAMLLKKYHKMRKPG